MAVVALNGFLSSSENNQAEELRLNILFQPDDRLMAHIVTEWSNGDNDAFFSMVRHSDLLECIRKHQIKPIRYSVTLDET